ncbi:ABC transporter ATP-binding protein [Candidatus Levyibacteriota bacterium]|nr:ABC transporter ATP-binding protein [Candidatus Levybacteria bacterium]GDX61981.1 ABC transporter ATP-binding protein [Candidatus Levybacteria bacterium]
MDKNIAISLNGVSKKFNNKIIIHNTSLDLPRGKIFTMIGPNGAGKTTLIKMMVGLLTPTSGNIKIFGCDIVKEPIEAKKKFGFISDDPSAYDYLSGLEFLALTGKLRGMEELHISNRIREIGDIFPLDDILYQPMAYYSRGSRQKIALLSALIHNPKILFIDEPIVGLDPASINIFGNILLEFKKNEGTVFFVTHTLSFADNFADHVFIMNNGIIIKDQPISKNSLDDIYMDALNDK